MSERPRLLVVVNHAAARARAAWPGVRAALERAGVSFDAHETPAPGEAQAATREALRAGYETVAAVGGDGTLSEVASGFFEPAEEARGGAAPARLRPSAALAVLPSGTGDDFARGLTGGRREPLEAWLARLVAHCRAPRAGPADAAQIRVTTRTADVLWGSVADVRGGARRFVCLNAVTLGIGAEVAARVGRQGARVRRLPGEARFALAAVAALAAWRDRRARVRVDEGEWRACRTNILAVTNGAYAGGGMHFSPGARIDDGQLDVLTACGLSTPSILRELSRIRRGGHLQNPRVTAMRGTRVRIETDDSDPLGVEADGDPRGHTPAEFHVIPSALRVVW